jgi:hypothetical protein
MNLVTAVEPGQVDLSWNNPPLSSEASEVEVLRRTIDTAFAPIATLSSNQSSYVDMSVTAGTEYYYRVVYKDDMFYSSRSYMSSALAT